MHCSKTHEKIMAELRHPMLALAATCGDYVVALASTHELKPVGKHDVQVERLKGTACLARCGYECGDGCGGVGVRVGCGVWVRARVCGC